MTVEKLPRRTKWMYGSGDFGFSLTDTLLRVCFLIFLTDVVGVEPKVAALAFLIGGTWDFVNDPIVGYITDRTHTHWGRRRPYLLFGALPFGLAFALLWWKPPFTGTSALAFYYSLAYILYDTAATFVYMPFFALTPELTSDYDERTSLTSHRMVFSILGSLVAFSLAAAGAAYFNSQYAGLILTMGITFGLIAALPLWLVFWGTHERKEFMELEQAGLIESIKTAAKNRPFIFGLLLFLFNGVTMAIIQVNLLYYIKYVVQREAQGIIILPTIFVVAILALPLWVWISNHLNKRWAYIIGISFLAVVLMVLASLNPETSMTLIMILCVLAGIGVSAMHVMPWAIIPDAIEYGELQSGKRSEGMFYSLIQLAQKVAQTLAVPAAIMVLQYSGFVSNGGTQPESAITGIRIVAGPIPAFTIGMGILFTALFPLGRENYKEINRQLEERRRASSEPADIEPAH